MTIHDEQDSVDARGELRQPRQSRLIKAALECDRFGRFDVTLRNVSQTGVGGQGPHIFNPQERVTVYLPGHQPMGATVRWVFERRFGIETDGDIRLDDLRAAHGSNLPSADGAIEFRIIPPPKLTSRRPGLATGAANPNPSGKSDWTCG